MILQDFHSIRPPYETAQEKTLDWLIEAHCLAEGLATGLPVDDFRKMLTEKFWHVGCKPDRIAKRGHILSDYLHQNWSEMEVYKVQESPIGSDLGVRMKHYQEHADQILKEYYPEGARAPDDLIHVSCTGYASPSAAQKLVSLRNWGEKTTVTHAYHMGCYGALAAIRIGEGYLSAGKEQVDLVHTELCSLHSNPSLHRLDQLVSQSLFADGYMKYSLKRTELGF
jgi:predicted naringenin-chalcone synthase